MARPLNSTIPAPSVDNDHENQTSSESRRPLIQLMAAAASISIVVVVGHGPLENQIECIINTSEKVQGAS